MGRGEGKRRWEKETIPRRAYYCSTFITQRKESDVRFGQYKEIWSGNCSMRINEEEILQRIIPGIYLFLRIKNWETGNITIRTNLFNKVFSGNDQQFFASEKSSDSPYFQFYINKTEMRDSIKLKSAFERWQHIFKTVRHMRDSPPVYSKTAHLLLADFEKDRF